MCLAGGGCDEEVDCAAESDALYDACEATDEATEACAAYCGTVDECAPGELYEDFGECVIECELDNVLVGPECTTIELSLLSCYGALTCDDWDATGGEDSPCSQQEADYDEVCF